MTTRLAKLRRERGWTQYDVADLLGKTQAAVWAWESQKAVPHPRTRTQLQAIFGEPVDALLASVDGEG